MPRERLPATEEPTTFYHADLIGLAAVTADGAALGTVTAVQNFGAGDLLEIAPHGGGAPLMLPFTEAAVPAVDIAGGRIVVDPPPDASTIEARHGRSREAGLSDNARRWSVRDDADS